VAPPGRITVRIRCVGNRELTTPCFGGTRGLREAAKRKSVSRLARRPTPPFVGPIWGQVEIPSPRISFLL
jgi:hypothetical protein